MSGSDPAARFALWARPLGNVRAAVLVGSRQRGTHQSAGADRCSDWDIQLVVRRPEAFRQGGWLSGVGLGPAAAYAVRKPLWAGGFKVGVVLAEAELDLLVMPAGPMRRLRWAAALGWHRRSRRARRALEQLGLLVRQGWRFLKRAGWVEALYRSVSALPEPRLPDAEIRRIAAGFVCDYVWTIRKIERGELLAAQRMLHLGLAEANFRLHHEARARRGQPSFAEARRAEQVNDSAGLAAIRIDSACAAGPLRRAADQAAAACEARVGELLGRRWALPRLRPPAIPPPGAQPPPKNPPAW
ncbi:MAG TPA: hypothetical protein VHC86_05495 [Opitutaceae bacterium]|nr:hypothetical protein [Opitutaceae bacterium]